MKKTLLALSLLLLGIIVINTACAPAAPKVTLPKEAIKLSDVVPAMGEQRRKSQKGGNKMKKVIAGWLTVMLVASLISGCYQAPAPSPTPKPPTTLPAPTPAPKPPVTLPVPTGGTTRQVTIKNFAFSPSQITIKAGDSVTWTNQGSAPHTATGSGFNSGQLATGQSWSNTFKTVGTFTYKCANHSSMQGQVTVESSG